MKLNYILYLVFWLFYFWFFYFAISILVYEMAIMILVKGTQNKDLNFFYNLYWDQVQRNTIFLKYNLYCCEWVTKFDEDGLLSVIA